MGTIGGYSTGFIFYFFVGLFLIVFKRFCKFLRILKILNNKATGTYSNKTKTEEITSFVLRENVTYSSQRYQSEVYIR